MEISENHADLASRTTLCAAVIFNPVSGQSDPLERKNAIENALAAAGYRCIHFETTPEEGAGHHTKIALRDAPDLIAVSGGDGTVVEAMSALRGTDIPLMVLPAGTGNLLAHNLNIPLDTAEAVRAALKGTPQVLDMAKLTLPDGTAHEFAIVAGAGFDARVIRDADRETKNRLGLWAYLFSAFKNLYRRPVQARLFLDDAPHPIRRRVRSVMTANMGKLQGGVVMTPDVRPDDGLLYITILKAETLRHWIALLWNALRRRLREDSSIEFFSCKKVRVELSRPQPIQYDGEDVEKLVRGFTVEILPQSVHVLVPNTASGDESP